mgnify:CR=1 FL=1|jgi:uncharacterized repeat protein (TIGR01451 family)
MRKLFLTIAALLLLAVVAAPPVMAVGTPAGTTISNQATASYKDANGNAMTPVSSNTVTVTVSQVFALNITPLTSNNTGQNETYVYFPGSVYNLGNGSDTFSVSWATTSGWAPTSVAMFRDVNDNGVYDAGTDTLIDPTVPGGNTYSTGSLSADAYAPIIMRVEVPDNTTAPDASTNTITVTVVSSGDSSKTLTATCTTTVSAAVIAASKAHVSVVTGTTTPKGTPTYRPGDEVLWTVTMTNNGSGTATAISAIDNLPVGVTFVPGSIQVKGPLDADWQARNDACGDDTETCYDSANRRILIPGSGDPAASPYFLPSGATYLVRLKVTIDAQVAYGTNLSNLANVTYASGASTVTVNTNTDTLVVENLAAIDLNKGTPASVNKSGNPGDYITYAFDAVNNGNRDDKIDLTVNSSNGWTWTIYHDSNNNKVYDAGTDTVLTDTGGAAAVDTNTLTLNGGLIHLIARAQVPAGRADTTTDTLTVTGTSVNDATKTDTVSWTTTVTAPYLVITKELVLVHHTANIGGSVPADCTPTNKSTGAGCNYYPGSTLTYQVTARNTGSGNATAVVIADAVPGNTTYVAGSIRTGETVALLTGKTDVNDGDDGTYDGSSVIAGGTSGFTLGQNATMVLEFKVTID